MESARVDGVEADVTARKPPSPPTTSVVDQALSRMRMPPMMFEVSHSGAKRRPRPQPSIWTPTTFCIVRSRFLGRTALRPLVSSVTKRPAGKST